MARPQFEKPDIAEHGAAKDGVPQISDRRLFMQLLAFTGCTNTHELIKALKSASISCALYEDLNDPRGVALLTFSEKPDFFVTALRRLLNEPPFAPLTLKPQFTMFGRTYALGHEPELNEVLFDRPRRTATNPDWPWVVWYPLRRKGSFSQLLPHEQRDILLEHAGIGFNFGGADYAHDIRLACHGLDANDNDFIIGLVGKELHPLSALVQTMRKTKQTSRYLEKLGPFFIGKVAYQFPG